jgi:lipopolysaccharide/colanic/teichoic acid biosynthesis glycosyltransferase
MWCAVKRGMDIALALLGLTVLLPALLGIALLVKLTSPGPVLFVQARTGCGGRPFPLVKFRTMHVHLEDRTGFCQTVKNDPRVTWFGALLRRKSLDELPQLLNVLAGHMSLVGPRPHVTPMLAGGVEYEELVPYYRLRQAVRPGLTGWAQVNFYRGPTTDARRAIARIDHDIAYIQNFSIWLDVKILLLTLWREFFGAAGC